RTELVEAHVLALQRVVEAAAEEQREEQQQGRQCQGAGAGLHRFIRMKGSTIVCPARMAVEAAPGMTAFQKRNGRRSARPSNLPGASVRPRRGWRSPWRNPWW